MECLGSERKSRISTIETYYNWEQYTNLLITLDLAYNMLLLNVLSPQVWMTNQQPHTVEKYNIATNVKKQSYDSDPPPHTYT